MKAGQATHSYKTVGGCEIQADVYMADDSGPRPVVIWIHGGALIMGHRGNLPAGQRDGYLNAGYAVVAIDYRLAPETRLPAIIEDVRDACRWARETGPGLFGADPDRIAVIGHSGGGYLALMTGFDVDRPPNTVVSFYGYGDIVGDWYSRPDPFYRQQPLVTKKEAYQAVGQSCLSGTPDQHDRHRFYLYCRQQGVWPREVAGRDPEVEPEAFHAFCPVRNVTATYPPTLLLHGDRDTDVPYQQSVMMAEALEHAGVEHELVTIPGGGHGFDGGDHPMVAEALGCVMAFLKRHLG